MNEPSKKDKLLTAQVVADMLETLPFMGKIVIAAHYLDGYDRAYISEIFEMTEEVVDMELRRAMTYIMLQCLDYEKLNRCHLRSVDRDVLRDAFVLLFKRHKYNMSEDVSITLYNVICNAICA